MSWIKTLGPEDHPYIKEKQEERLKQFGFISNFSKGLTLLPDVQILWDRLVWSVCYGGTSLGKRREELIATVVSALNDCTYALTLHSELLRNELGGDAESVRAIKERYDAPVLDEAERAIVTFTKKVTLEPWNMTDDDHQSLARYFNETEIVEIASTAAWMNMCNRMINSLGIEVEPQREDWRQFLYRESNAWLEQGGAENA